MDNNGTATHYYESKDTTTSNIPINTPMDLNDIEKTGYYVMPGDETGMKTMPNIVKVSSPDVETVADNTDEVGLDITCKHCMHYGVCKYEDKLQKVYSDILDKTSAFKFIEGIDIKCKHFKDANPPSLTFQPGQRQIPELQKDRFFYNPGPYVGGYGVGSLDNTITLTDDDYPKAHFNEPVYPTFPANGEYPQDIASKDELLKSTDEYLQNRGIGTIGVTDDKGNAKSITTKVLSTGKKSTTAPKADVVVTGDNKPIQKQVTATPYGVMPGEPNFPNNVPTQTINPNDLPERFRNSIKEAPEEIKTRVIETKRVNDNTGRESQPGQTTNVVK